MNVERNVFDSKEWNRDFPTDHREDRSWSATVCYVLYRNSIYEVRRKWNMNILCKDFTNEIFRAIISSIQNYIV